MTKFNPRERVVKAKIQLQREAPFFAHLVLSMTIKEDKNIPSMGVSFDGNARYNPDWIDTLTDSQIKGVLCHEVMHVALSHLARLGKKDMFMWNVACDMLINWMISIEGFELPKEGILPKYGSTYEIPFKDTKLVVDVKDKTANEVYELLQKEAEANGGGQGEGSCGGEGGDLPKGFDQHDYGEGLTDDEVRQVEKEWKGKIADAYVAAREKYRGDIPGYLKRLVEELLHPKLPWKPLLYQYITKDIPFNSTYRKPGRRTYSTGVYMPSEVKENLNVLVTVDCSGSISTDEYQEFISEIHGIASAFEQIDMRLLHWDTQVNLDKKITRVNKNELLETEVTGGGGTRMGCVKEYIEDNNINNPTISVHLTDGYVEDYPEVTMGQHLFVISKGGSPDRVEHLGRITSMV